MIPYTPPTPHPPQSLSAAIKARVTGALTRPHPAERIAPPWPLELAFGLVPLALPVFIALWQ